MREKQVGYHVQLRTPRSREQCKLMGKSGEVHPKKWGGAPRRGRDGWQNWEQEKSKTANSDKSIYQKEKRKKDRSIPWFAIWWLRWWWLEGGGGDGNGDGGGDGNSGGGVIQVVLNLMVERIWGKFKWEGEQSGSRKMSSRRKWAAWNGSTRSHTDKYKITNKQIQIKDHTHTNK